MFLLFTVSCLVIYGIMSSQPSQYFFSVSKKGRIQTAPSLSSWRRSDGRRLDESKTTLMRGDSVLRIRDLAASDAGRYICVVAGGSERQYFDVTLETSWQGKSPLITRSINIVLSKVMGVRLREYTGMSRKARARLCDSVS